jgi:transposase, IS30 family
MGTNYEQLSLDERCELARLHANGLSCRAIGRTLGRSGATISRELRRNSGPKVGYKVSWAMIQTRARRCRKLYKLERSSTLRERVLDSLAMGQSPEQIAGRFELENGKSVISPESIYRYIYWRQNSHKEYLHKLLPRAKFRRGWRGRKGGSSVKTITARIPIQQRPPEVAARSSPGHWEADLMAFSRYGQQMLVAVERTTRFLRADSLPNKQALPLARTLRRWFRFYPRSLRRSLTVDNGTEFAEHQRLKRLVPLGTFFCDPHSPWQKGSVENAIGRLRRDLPRKTNLATLTPEDIHDIVLTYNSTPRKCLGFRTPAEAFLNLLKTASVALEM